MTDATRTWQDNAQEYADLDQGEGWAFAVLVACSVENVGKGANPQSRIKVPGKVPAEQFAQRAGTSGDRVLRYLEGWNRAATVGTVPPGADLTPSDTHKVTLPDVPWGQFSAQAHDRSVDESRRARITAQAEKEGVGPSKTINIVANPKALAAAIKADAATADAARQALQQSWDKNYQREWAQPPRPSTLTPEQQARARQAELTARERELAEERDTERALGSMTILSDLAHAREPIDRFVTHWSNRRIRLTDAEKAAYATEIAAGRRAWDQAEQLGEGRDSLDDELQRLVGDER